MRILLVNDDGYRAPGLRTLGHAMQQAGHQVIVAAPDRERSAASHSFTIQSPLRAKTFREDGLRVTPSTVRPRTAPGWGCS